MEGRSAAVGRGARTARPAVNLVRECTGVVLLEVLYAALMGCIAAPLAQHVTLPLSPVRVMTPL